MKKLTRVMVLCLFCFSDFYTGLQAQTVDNSRPISDLVMIARVWGYLKYFAPTISERNIDWDKVLISQLQYLDENPSAGIDLPIRIMLDSAAPVSPSGKKTGAQQLARAKRIEKVNIDHSWITRASQLQSADKERLQALADYFVPFRNKYVASPEAAQRPSPVFTEDTYGKDYLPEKHYRLLALFRYWNIIEYYLPAKYQQQGTWPETLAQLIPEFAAANTNRTYARALLKLNAAITDAHSIMPVYGKYPELVLSGTLMRIPFQMVVVNDKALVMQTDSGFREQSGIRKGDHILAVNGVSVMRYVDSLKAFMSEPRDEMKQYYVSTSGMLQLMPVNGDSLTVTFESAGRQQHFSMAYGAQEAMAYGQIAGRAWREKSERAKREPVKPAMQMLEGDVLFIDPSKWTGSMSDTTRTLLAKARSLIIECRTYPNFDFINFTHFLFKKKTECILWNSVDNYPGLTKTSRYFRGPDHKIHFKGPVVALISERSLSRPEMLTMIVKARGGNTKLIGRTTGGADGDVTQIPMVGNQDMRFMISGLGVLYPNGDYTQGIGIRPDITVPDSLEQISGDKDAILDRALQYLSSLK